MEKPSRSKVTKMMNYLPKPATFVIPNPGQNRPGKPKAKPFFEPSKNKYELFEPTSPKISCMGQIKSKAGHRRNGPPPPPSFARQWRKLSVAIRRIFRRGRKVGPSRTPDAAEDDGEGRRLAAAAPPPPLGQMRRFASGRKKVAGFECGEEEMVEVVMAVEPKKEVNIWKRRVIAPPIRLELN